MNIDKVIAEVAEKTGTILNKEDPLLVAIILNKTIIEEYIKDLEIQLYQSITNVAIKEDLTITKLHKLLNEKQTLNNQETKRILNQFADNLQSKLHTIINNQPIIKIPFLGLSITFIIGIILGGLLIKVIL